MRNRQLAGLRFRRQVPIGPVIVDFLCEAQRLIIEVDDGQRVNAEADLRRTAFLNAQGYKVQSVGNTEVLSDLESVLERIADQQGASLHPDASSGRTRSGGLGCEQSPGGKGTPVAREVLDQFLNADFNLSLSYEQRYRRRGVLHMDCGMPFLLDLAEATELALGAGLKLEDGRVIAVHAAVEPLTEIRGEALPRLAWHIGNRHTPCQVEAERLLIQRDHVLEDMLRRLGAEIVHVEEPFQPEGGAYGHGRTHAHTHSHDPHVDPNAHIPHRHNHTHE